MSHPVKHVFIAGGTGFIGFHAGKAFLEKQIKVSSIALPDEIKVKNTLFKDFNLSYGNLFTMTPNDLFSLFDGKDIDTLVYALGPDERVTPSEDAFLFFYEFLVSNAYRILLAAKQAGIRRAIVLNSYFSHFDKLSGNRLSNRHPYIKARRLQEVELALLSEENQFDVLFLELPYIFGVMEGRKPLWGEFFLEKAERKKAIYFPKHGGTCAVDVKNVARAIVGAAFFGENRQEVVVADENILFSEMVQTMLLAKKSTKKLVEIPAWIAGIGAWFMEIKDRRAGKHTGLNHFWLMLQIQNQQFYVEAKAYQKLFHFDELGYHDNFDVRTSIINTIQSIYQ